MFCYNLVSQNNFQNEIVLDLIKFVNDYANLLFFKKKAHVIIELIDIAAQEASMFLTSLLMYRFPELRSIVDPQIVNAAEQNLDAFQRVLNELESYYRGQVSYFQMFLGNSLQQGKQMNPGFQQNQNQLFTNQIVTDPNTGVQYVQNIPIQVFPGQVSPGYPVANPQVGPGFINQSGYFQPRPTMQPVQFQQRPEHTAGAQSEAFSDRFGRSTVDHYETKQTPSAVTGFFTTADKETANPEIAAEPKKELTVKDWRSSLEEPYLILPNLYNQSYFFDFNEQGRVSQFIEVTDPSTEEEIEDGIVDRAAHLKFFNKTEKVIQTQLKQDANLLFEITDKKLETAKASDDYSLISSYIYKSCYVTTSFDELYYKALYEQEKQDTQIYRIFGIICEPFFLTTDFSKFIYDFYFKFFSVNSLELFSMDYKKLKETPNYFEPHTFKETSNLVRENYNFKKLIYKLDSLLTEIFNDFIKGNMSLKIEIDSFFSDYEELKLYIQKKYPKIYFTELESFEEKIKQRLAPKMDEETMKDVTDNLDIGDTDNIAANIISKTVSLTLIDAKIDEIINPAYIRDLKETPMLILRKNNPKLYKIAASIFEQAPAMIDRAEPIANYLKIGIDPTIFKIYKGVIGTDAYLIGVK
jgi:hypothetical protein